MIRTNPKLSAHSYFCILFRLVNLLNYIQSSGNSLFGIKIYAQQFFALISCTLLLTSMMLFRSYVKKSKA